MPKFVRYAQPLQAVTIFLPRSLAMLPKHQGRGKNGKEYPSANILQTLVGPAGLEPAPDRYEREDAGQLRRFYCIFITGLACFVAFRRGRFWCEIGAVCLVVRSVLSSLSLVSDTKQNEP